MVLSAALAGVLAIPGTALASPTSPHTYSAPKKAAPLTGQARVDQESASALKQAKATGKNVPVRSLTTSTSTTVADPRGTLTLTQNVEPVRVWQNGAWRGLDARLHRNADHTLSPNATSSGLVLSGGGSGPLATMTSTGHTMSLAWPTPLPTPTISGATATYASVLNGVDLVVTVSPQGGFSDTLVVKNKAAATDPRLTRLTMATTSNDLSVTADAAGNLKAAAATKGEPVFAASAPVMWDSATTAPKPGTQPMPASSATTPSPHAHLAPIKASAEHEPLPRTRTPGTRRGSITLVPDHAMLTRKSTVFPLYIDPTWVTQHAGSTKQAWAQTDTINKSAAHYKPSELQNGYCGWDTCIPTFTAESYVRMSVPSQLQGAQIYSSELDLTVAYGPYSSCSSAPNPGLELWWTGGISSSTTWNNAPAWHSKINTQTPPACPGQNVRFPITSFMQSHAQGVSSLTFGIAATSETNKDAWKQFHASTLTMSTTYDRAPKLPSIPATSPGGPCQTGSPSATVIGNDDVTFETVASDPDGGQLGTEFVVKNYGGTTVYDSGDPQSASGALTSTSGGVVRLVLKRAQIQGWHTDGATNAYAYSWYTRTSDGKLYSPTTGTGSAGSPCNFTYDPSQPGAPGVAVTTDAAGYAGALGQNATFTLAPCAGALDDPPTTCTGASPNRYRYQINSGPPQSIPATGGVQTVQIPLTHTGPNTLTVFAISTAGNAGDSASTDFTVTGPSIPYPDGDIDGDSAHHPDLLASGTGANPGLWLASGDGAGGLGTPTDVGAAGTGINGGPADWNGAQVLHGDFTGKHVQDVIAYYPSGSDAGGGSLLYGNGDAVPLNPGSDSEENLPTDQFADYTLNADGDVPTQLVAAGNASLTGTGIADLIGITGDATNGYQLDLYTACGGCGASTYSYLQTLAGPADSPDGAADWNNFTLTTAQPGGQTVLFALKKTTGELWEATNPTQNAAIPIGTPAAAGGTWTKLTVPWTSTTVPTLVSGDVNAAGAIELWAQSSTNVTPYTLSASTLSKGTTVSLLAPGHEWPLTSSTGTTSSCTATTCTPDTRGGTDTAVTGGVTFTNDPAKGTVTDLDGTGYLTPPAGLIAASTTLTISLSFRADPGTTGILLSTGSDTPDKLNINTMPVMYIGTDGRLYAQYWNGYVRPMVSAQPVNDGQWHTATLGADGNNQSLFVDDDLRVGMAGSPDIRNLDPLNFVGAGVFPLSSTKFWVNAPGDTTKTRVSYFHGEISDVSYYTGYLTPAQVTPFHQPKAVTGPITSELSSNLCVDDNGNGTTNGNKIQIYTCNGSAAQQWTITPDPTNGLNNTVIDHKCMTVSGGGTANSTPIVLSDCTGAASQEWHLDSLGQLWNPHSGRCLADPASSTPGTQLIIYDCDYNKEQNWHVP